jgi:hypothetical protein
VKTKAALAVAHARRLAVRVAGIVRSAVWRAQLERRRLAVRVELARYASSARARAVPQQLSALRDRAAPRDRVAAPRMPTFSRHPVLLGLPLFAILAFYLGVVRDDSAVVAAPAPLMPAADVAAPPPAPAPLTRVRVNARPWAYVRVDGVEVGPTPLSHLRLEAGPHEFEAQFADGRRLRQQVIIGPGEHSVSLR